ncbi:hypothetical protein ACJMK2_009247 [Sinanodonta woodiana]|uniref:Claudin n=1 Tax=Sinanodonta woodiana TaxID=1069815 RepID=A0ABD3VD77_SINWO
MSDFQYHRLASFSTLLLGTILNLIATGSNSWQGIEDGIYFGLWNVCFQIHSIKHWTCTAWDVLPDFIRSAQAFCIIGQMCYIVSAVLMLFSFFVRALQRSKVVLIVLSLLTFSAACLVSMTVVVMGVKGKDYIYSMKTDTELIFRYFLKGVVLSGLYEIGWSMIVAIVASLVTFIAFLVCFFEYRDITEEPRPTRV